MPSKRKLQEQIDEMREILRTVWYQTHAEEWRPEVKGDGVYLDAATLRKVARLFVKEEGDDGTR